MNNPTAVSPLSELEAAYAQLRWYRGRYTSFVLRWTEKYLFFCRKYSLINQNDLEDIKGKLTGKNGHIKIRN
jgi:hypothetical protein